MNLVWQRYLKGFLAITVGGRKKKRQKVILLCYGRNLCYTTLLCVSSLVSLSFNLQHLKMRIIIYHMTVARIKKKKIIWNVIGKVNTFGGSFQTINYMTLWFSPMEKKFKKAKWLSGEALQIAVKRREVKSKGEKERYTHLSAVQKNSKER